ncbi:MAG: MBL fold metallo-hydrolase [Anaerolineales bacterium]|nr:MBL fold metallo-hydrolase [Anaerolineales bacterium]
MPELIILGSAASIPNLEHDNSHMMIRTGEGIVLIDSGTAPVLRLERLGIPTGEITDVILTHFHPDHVSGLPLLLMSMWLEGRSQVLRIYGLHHCLKRVEDLMDFYQWGDWPDFFPVAFHRLPENERVMVLEQGDVTIYSSPVSHVIPTIGLRIEAKSTGKVIAYSCDTEPCQAIIDLAQGAAMLFHEATGENVGHSSAAQAGETARDAGVESLYLIHYPVGGSDLAKLVEEARGAFSGDVYLAEDFMKIEF